MELADIILKARARAKNTLKLIVVQHFVVNSGRVHHTAYGLYKNKLASRTQDWVVSKRKLDEAVFIIKHKLCRSFNLLKQYNASDLSPAEGIVLIFDLGTISDDSLYHVLYNAMKFPY